MNIERFIANRIIRGSDKRNQFSRPVVRTSVLGIALGLAVMILTVAVINGFQTEIQNKLIGFGSHIQVTNYDNNVSDEPQPISKQQAFLKTLIQNPEVNHVEVYATKSGIIKTKTDNEGVMLKGIGKDFDWKFISENMKSGKVFEVSDTGLSKQIVISKFLADKLELQLNDKMAIYFLTKKPDSAQNGYEQRAKVFYISGIYETGFEDIDKRLVLIDIGQIQKLNYWSSDQIGGFEIALKDYKKIDAVGTEVNEMIGQGLIAQTVKEINPTVFSWLEMQDVNAIVVISLMILVAGINMISALLILILERTNMIGILKAIGARNSSIRTIFLYNAAYLIGKGLLFGNLLGIGIALIQKYTGVLKLNQATYYVSVVPIRITITDLVMLNTGTFLCCLLMIIIPSFIISKISPVKSIRFS